MIRKVIKYQDYNGVDKKEAHYFNLNKVELAKLETGSTGGFQESMKKLIEAEDMHSMIEVIEDVIQKSYGVKTPDGKFLKRKEDLEMFMASPAYPELFMELATNTEAATEFFNGLIPADMVNQAKKTQDEE